MRELLGGERFCHRDPYHGVQRLQSHFLRRSGIHRARVGREYDDLQVVASEPSGFFEAPIRVAYLTKSFVVLDLFQLQKDAGPAHGLKVDAADEIGSRYDRRFHLGRDVHRDRDVLFSVEASHPER